jgi:UDP-N-acetylmuramate dehydrogenase
MDLYDRCKQNVPLSTLSTFGIGGAALWLFRAEQKEDLQEALGFVSKEKCPFMVLGRGSNCLFSDEGFLGVVIQNRVNSFQDLGDGLFEVGGGVSFPSVGTRTARDGWGGLEFAVGIPGSVGGAVFMNAASHTQHTADSVAWVDYIDEQGAMVRLKREELSFGYRYSSLQNRRGAIAGVGFCLKRDETAILCQQEMVERRKRTQPIHDRSAGCVFRNPPGASAGALIEQAGLKGMVIGGAEVSRVHANFIVNRHGATARNVIDLMNHIREVVAQKTGVLLESEIRIVPSTFA